MARFATLKARVTASKQQQQQQKPGCKQRTAAPIASASSAAAAAAAAPSPVNTIVAPGQANITSHHLLKDLCAKGTTWFT
eukprot:gene4325-30696_t